MKNYSNKYIFIYTTILVAVVAILLTAVSVGLKPLQEKNRTVEKIKNILSSAGYTNIDKNQIISIFNNVTTELCIDSKCQVVSSYHDGNFAFGSQRAFNLDENKEFYKAFNGDKSFILPVYQVKNKSGNNSYVVPVTGKGLWGKIWGYIAIAADGKTINGTVFLHKSETPGLGGEISSEKFSSSFKGKTIFNDSNKFVSIKLVKTQSSSDNTEHTVDAISGGTITSEGVQNMMYDCLILYTEFFNNIKEQ